MSRVSVELVHVGVNMGDHAVTITKAIEANEDMTLGELYKLLTRQVSFTGDVDKDLEPSGDKYLIIRPIIPFDKAAMFH